MRKLLGNFAVLLAVVGGSLGLLNCTTSASFKQATTIEVLVKEPNRVRFSGKGAGAGMMLSGTMGPMGVAIGIAIDEGIAKDIDKTAREGGVVIEDIVQRAVSEVLDEIVDNKTRHGKLKTITITVERYGFVTAQGEGDTVLPHLQFMISIADRPPQRVVFPDQLKSEISARFPPVALSEIKSNAHTIEQTFFKSAYMSVAAFLYENI